MALRVALEPKPGEHKRLGALTGAPRLGGGRGLAAIPSACADAPGVADPSGQHLPANSHRGKPNLLQH
jgi:hypothetical protein